MRMHCSIVRVKEAFGPMLQQKKVILNHATMGIQYALSFYTK